MATKEKLKTKAARVREEARETGKVILRAPALVRAAECVIRFLLGAMLSGAEIFGGYAPFGLGLVAASGSGLDGFCALLGACFGYLSFQGFAEGLRYVAGCILAFSLAFAFFDVKAYRKSWFMPLAAAGMDGITGFVYLSDRGWSPEGLIFFGTELLLCGASAYFYRIAFTPWTEKREEEGLTPRQTVSLLILAGTLLLTLSKITLLGDLSVGRCAAAAAVMATAYKGGIGVGATVGVACGLGMDLAAGGMPFYSMAFALSGVMCGVFHRQGRLAAALAYVLSNALAVLWTWSEGLHLSLLYEVFIASVVFLVLPERALRQVGALVAREPRHDTQERARAYVRARMEATAAAFKSLYESMRSAFHPAAPNDNDAASVFDRAAGRICKRCPLQTACWQRDYVSTFNALNDALPAMLERGRGESGDFPAYFSNRCMKFPEFLSAANEELAAQLIPEGAQEALDTLTEIAQWIQDHPNDASAMNAAITKLNGIVAGIGGDEDEYATVMAAIEGKITAALKDIASGATKVEKSEVNGNIKINGQETVVYTHPAVEAVEAGFKKVGKDNQGHVVLGDDVTKEDIVALGIPAQDTTYQPATSQTNGLMSKEDKVKLDGIEVATDEEVNQMLDEVFGAAVGV